MEAQVVKVTAELSAKEAELDQCTAEFQHVFQDFTNAKNQMSNERQTAESQLLSLKNQISREEAECRRLQEENDQANTLHCQMMHQVEIGQQETAELDQLRSKISKAKAKLQGAKEDRRLELQMLQKLRSEKHSLAQDLNKLEKQWTELAVKSALRTDKS